jgi:hypothetical protein
MSGPVPEALSIGDWAEGCYQLLDYCIMLTILIPILQLRVTDNLLCGTEFNIKFVTSKRAEI